MAEKIKMTPEICGSERAFLALKGDGSEEVQVTFGDATNDLNGWYLFERVNGKNVFSKQHIHQERYPNLVERFCCEIGDMQFDEHFGIRPRLRYHQYCPLGNVHAEERDAQIEKLKARRMWH